MATKIGLRDSLQKIKKLRESINTGFKSDRKGKDFKLRSLAAKKKEATAFLENPFPEVRSRARYLVKKCEKYEAILNEKKE